MSKTISNLPAEFNFYINCNRGFDVREQLLDEYGINDLTNGSLVVRTLEDVYVDKISVYELDVIFKQLPLSTEKRKQFLIDVLGRCLLVMDDYLDGQVFSLLSELGGKPEDYLKYVSEFEADWKEEAKKLIAEGVISPEEDYYIDDSAEKVEIIEQLSGDLSYLLSAETSQENEALQEANWLMGYVLLKDSTAKNEFIKTLINNQSQLTSSLAINDDPQLTNPNIVSAWLGDYLAFAGNRFNDNLMAARYLIESDRIKKVSAIEKLRIKNLISLYRNLNNFPLNFDAKHPERLQFFPVDLLKIEYGDLTEPVNKNEKEIKKEVAVEIKAQSVVEPEKPVKKTPASLAAERYLGISNKLNIKSELLKWKIELTTKKNEELIAMWQKALTDKDLGLVIACLIELFGRPQFSSVLFATPEIREILTNQATAYPSLLEPSIGDGVINSTVLAILIKAILQRLDLSEEENAVAFLQIASHDPNLASFVYFDTKKKVFAWRQFTEV